MEYCLPLQLQCALKRQIVVTCTKWLIAMDVVHDANIMDYFVKKIYWVLFAIICVSIAGKMDILWFLLSHLYIDAINSWPVHQIKDWLPTGLLCERSVSGNVLKFVERKRGTTVFTHTLWRIRHWQLANIIQLLFDCFTVHTVISIHIASMRLKNK